MRDSSSSSSGVVHVHVHALISARVGSSCPLQCAWAGVHAAGAGGKQFQQLRWYGLHARIALQLHSLPAFSYACIPHA